MASQGIKNRLFETANLVGADRLFRRLNKRKLLVVMYHGITANSYNPSIWTQLPLATFVSQLEFLRREYVFVSLDEVVTAIRKGTLLPERAVLITFDDGLKNNFTVAFPVLKQFSLPAAVFLTVDYVDSDEILWVDELYFFIHSAVKNRIAVDLQELTAQRYLQSGFVKQAYYIMAGKLKSCGAESRSKEMARLRAQVPLNRQPLREDFGMLGWHEVRAMQRSGLIGFGVHTATHRILSELTPDEWEKELSEPRRKLESMLDTEIAAFCYPNGRPGIDYRREHAEYLRSAGYVCAFTTGRDLFDPGNDDRMEIGRVAGGNDGTSEQSYFRLNASGALRMVKNLTRTGRK